jgi:hypothetical protein
MVIEHVAIWVGNGYYEFETLDPENNRLEVTTGIL